MSGARVSVQIPWLARRYHACPLGSPTCAQVACVSVQFPDPHFKKRHHKRRIVQPQLVDAVADALLPGRKVRRRNRQRSKSSRGGE